MPVNGAVVAAKLVKSNRKAKKEEEYKAADADILSLVEEELDGSISGVSDEDSNLKSLEAD